MSRENIKCTILGSFRFKEEIDLIRKEFEDHGVEILAPEKGQVYRPSSLKGIQISSSFHPLPQERHQPIKVVEDDFLKSIFRSDLVYLVDIDGYVGPVVSMEIGVTIAREIPLYAMQPINVNLDLDPCWRELVQRIEVKTVSEAISDLNN